MQKFSSISDGLRLAGAVAVAAAMGLFLLDGVAVTNDLQRFLTMLGFTAVLTAAGLGLSFLLKEQRGSRVFLGLSLLSIPVNFTVLGAMLYSIIPWDSLADHYPAFAHWEVAAFADLLPAMLAGGLVLLPVCWLAFSVMARGARVWLTAALLGSNAMLMIPVRQDHWIALLSIGITAALIMAYRRYGRESLALKTLEGKFAIAVLFVAPLILLARSLFLYEVSGILLLSMAGGLYAAFRHMLYMQSRNTLAEMGLSLASAASAVFVAMSVFDISEALLSGGIARSLSYFCLLALAWDITRRNSRGAINRSISILTVLLVSGLTVLEALFGMGLMNVLMSTALLLMIIMVCTRAALQVEAVCAGLAIVGIVMIYAGVIWSSLLSTGWWGVALIGAASIIAGSLLERMGPMLQLKVAATSADKAEPTGDLA